MARGSFFAGIMTSTVLGAALIVGLAAPAYAQNAPPKLTLAGSATFTTDYMFRSISNTKNDPAVQPEFDLTYGMFFFTLWGSNTSFGKNIEIDYYGGIMPKWGDFTFTIAGNEYTYPGGDDIDYFELHTAVAYAKGPWSLAIHNYWSPDNFQTFGNSNAIEGDVGYTFTGKLFGFFTPSISGAVGFQSYEEIASDYTYWNAGLTLGFMKNWSADIRYYDTTYNEDQCFINTGNSRTACDARAVGTIKATF
ncbi:MAG: TorF family putative porin [Methyloceanibacter sp.]